MKKKVLEVLLFICILAVVLTGCKNLSTNTTKAPTITWYVAGTKEPDHDEVINEVNKKLIERYNIAVDLIPIDYGSYSQKMQVINASQEKYDLAFTSSWLNSYYQNVSAGALMDISELLPVYAPKLYNSMEKIIWSAVALNGKIYAAPNWQIMSRSTCLAIPREFLTATNMTMENFNTLEDLTPYLKKLTSIYPEANKLGDGPFSCEYYGFIEIIDGNTPGVISRNDCVENGKPTAFNQFETKEFEECIKLVHDWVEKGLVSRDYLPDTSRIAVNKQQPFVFTAYKPGVEGIYKAETGMDCAFKQFSMQVLHPNAILSTLTGVSATSENPAKAVEMLEIVNNDKEIYNMLCWGLDGKHYTKVSDNIIENPNKQAYGFSDWMLGSVANSYVLNTQSADVWEQTKEFNDSALKSPLLGLAINTDNINSEIANCQTVINEQLKLLGLGLVEPDEGIRKLRESLKVAGSDKIIADFQTQIDKWWANKE